uniref:Endonuclease/exonuclease/phosphatase domain-containing protein n=1 Tax=Latimeria chalumnae TaxID=7897 RepID=H3ACV8_LATCH
QENEAEMFYEHLQSKTEKMPKSNMLIMMGDFTAKVGHDYQTWKPALGPHEYGDINERGERLLQFSMSNRFVIINSMFCHKASHKRTWLAPNNQMKTMIDFIIVNVCWRSLVLNTCTFQGPDIASDHSLVLSKIHSHFQASKRTVSKKKLDLEKLQDSTVRHAYQLELNNDLQ